MTQSRNAEPNREDVAIIGMAGRWPGADSPEALFDAALAGQSGISRLAPRAVLAAGRRHVPAPRADGRCALGLVAMADGPDPRRVGALPGAWNSLSPRERLLCDGVLTALEDAGLHLEAIKHCTTAVFIGAMGGGDGTQLGHVETEQRGDRISAMLRGQGFLLANRVSHIFGLTGDSRMVDTAHASALAAVHAAKTALARRECDVALVGAVSHDFAFWQGAPDLLSPDGRCAVFDAEANGVAPAEGAGVLVLMRNSDAVQEGAHIRSVIVGSAVGHGGDAVALGRPDREAQVRVIGAALEDAGLQPAALSAVEAHGTGTRIGDPVEMAALADVLGGSAADSRSAPCLVGSVKAVIGHAEAAAGMAGLQKAVRMLETGLVSPQPLPNRRNPLVTLPEGVLRLPDRPEALVAGPQGQPVTVGVTALGIGGSCAHVILQAHEETVAQSKPTGAADAPLPLPLLLSAVDVPALQAASDDWAAFAAEAAPAVIASALSSQALCRNAYPARRVLWGITWPELRAALAAPTPPTGGTQPDTGLVIESDHLRHPEGWARIGGYRQAVEAGHEPAIAALMVCLDAGLGGGQPLRATSIAGLQVIAQVTDPDGSGRPDRAVLLPGSPDPVGPVSMVALWQALQENTADGWADEATAIATLWADALDGVDTRATDALAEGCSTNLQTVLRAAALAPVLETAGLSLPVASHGVMGRLVTIARSPGGAEALVAFERSADDSDAGVLLERAAALTGPRFGPALDLDDMPDEETATSVAGLRPLAWENPLEELAALWESGVDLDWGVLWPGGASGYMPIPGHPPFVANPPETAVAQKNEATDAGEESDPTAGLRQWLRGLVAQATGRAADSIPDTAGLAEACGVDSLANEAILAKLTVRFGTLPSTLLFSFPTIAALTEALITEHGADAADFADAGMGSTKQTKTLPAAAGRPRRRTARAAAREPVAVVGLAGTFPGASDAHAFWTLLRDGVSAIGEVPADRWDWQAWAGVQGEADGGHYTRFGGFLADPYAFDPLFFSLAPSHAARMDPQQRVMLETAWTAVEDAGIRPKDLPRCTGVYIGASTQSFSTLAARSAEVPTGGKALTVETDLSDIANRISFLMDLHGPSLTVDTACSASLTGVHLALRALAAGDCDAAVVGGVNLTLDPLRISQFCDKGMLSPEAACRPFGDGPGGFVDGEGAVALVLKPLSQAQADGDRILCLLTGSAVNSGGRSSGYTVPDPLAQAALVREALDDAGVSAADVGYVECHGTGTRLGDPIELEGLSRAFRVDTTETGTCKIGSLKANIGHLIGAAGIAGLSKLVLQLAHRELAPSLNALPANPRLDFEKTPFRVVTEAQPWEPPRPGAGLTGGVSSFGSGGSNAHVIAQSYDWSVADLAVDPAHPARSGPQVVVLSARTADRLAAQAERLAAFLEGPEGKDRACADVAHTLRVGREPMAHRLGMIVASTGEIAARLRAWRAGAESGVVLGEGAIEPACPMADDDPVPTEEDLLNRAMAGEDVDWSGLYPSAAFRRVSLPGYAFERMTLGVPQQRPVPGVQGVAAPIAAVHAIPATSPTPVAAPPASGDPLDGQVFVPRWVSASLDKPVSEIDGVGLLVVGDGPLTDALLARYPQAEVLPREASVLVARLQDPQRPLPRQVVFSLVDAAAERLEDPTNPTVVERATLSGPLVLRALVTALSERAGLGLEGDWPHLRIVTADALPAGGLPVCDPLAAGLHGFAKSLAKEDSALPVSCLDISRADLQDPDLVLPGILAEPADARGDETVFRAGRRMRRELLAVEGGAEHPIPLRNEGVYLIVGGAGGLGASFSRHLAEHHRAKLVWMGRRPQDAEIEAQMATIRDAGGEVLYVSGDASDPCAVAAACAAARGRFGALHGVVHSAIVLNDKAVARMSDDDFRRAYDIKAAGIAALAKAVLDEPLDWFLVFSSGLSVLGFPGQSNYAAGCAVKDAMVHWLSDRVDLPFIARTINWGYWGTTGIVANPVHEKRLAALGLLGMDPAHGMAAVERALAVPAPQMLAMKATDRLLSTLGLRAERRLVPTDPVAELPLEVVEKADHLGAEPADPALAKAWRDGRAALEDAGPGFVLAALDPLGLRDHIRAAGAAGIAIPDLQAGLGVIDRHTRLFAACMRILARGGVVSLSQGGTHLTGTTQLDAATPLPPSVAGDIARAHPGLEGFCGLTEICLQRFAETVTGQCMPTDVMFPDGSMDLVDPIYRGNAEADRCNTQTTAAVVRLVQERLALLDAEGASSDAKVTVVEIGAGTGGTTRTLLPGLAAFGDRLRYVYTDVSRAFTAHGKRTFGTEYPFTEFELLDVERDPDPQGFPKGSVDVVVATNVLHATRDMRRTLGHVKSLLRDGGCLIANEITTASAFTTLTFGLLDGWWLFEDGPERLPDAPLLAPSTWQRLCGELGYRRVRLLAGLGPDGGLGDQNVIVAESDGLVETDRAVVTAPAGAAKPVAAAQAAPAAAVSGGEGGDALAIVVAAAARALGLSEDQVEADAAFRDYGVDSIVGVRLIREVNTALGSKLAVTDLFDHPSARRLAEAAKLTATGPVAPAPVQSPAAPAVQAAPAPAPVAAPAKALSAAAPAPSLAPNWTVEAVLSQIREAIADVLSVPVEAIDPSGDVSELGLDGADADAVAVLLGVALGVVVDVSLLHRLRTPRDLARALVGEAAPIGSPVTPVVAVPATPAVEADDSVAVIGMAGRFPGCPDVDAFWDAIVSGRNLVTPVPSDRWDGAALYDPDPNRLDRTHCRFGSFVEAADHFDPRVHGLSLKEAAWMDPQQRLFLDVCRDALEDSGHPITQFEGGSIGVFAGVGEGDYLDLIKQSGLAPPPQTFWGNASSVLAARIAYLLDLKGPALALDTACSSSLVAIHEACQAVLRRECDMALAGGVFLRFTPQFHIFASNAGMLSPTGRCAAFDDSADGFVPGEGAGAVLLKRLSDALADGDPIHGVIRASGLNQDGRTNGITAPSARSQTQLQRSVWAKAGIQADDLSYVEAHGTGTPLGDPVEFKALCEAVAGDPVPHAPIALGSVKANLGHAAMAAGVAGVLKLLLMLRARTLPPLVHYQTANKHLPLDGAPFHLPVAAEPWQRTDGKPLMAAVSSFGFSGTNAHVVVAEPPPRPAGAEAPRTPIRTPRQPIRCWFDDPAVASGQTTGGSPAVATTKPAVESIPIAVLETVIRAEAAALLGIAQGDLVTETDLPALGLTKPMAARLSAALGQITGAAPDPAQLLAARSVGAMAALGATAAEMKTGQEAAE